MKSIPEVQKTANSQNSQSQADKEDYSSCSYGSLWEILTEHFNEFIDSVPKGLKKFGRRSGPPHRLGSSLELKSASGPTDARIVGAQRRFSIPTEGESRPNALVGFS